MKNIIITGASGYIGVALIKRYLQGGATVYGVGALWNDEQIESLSALGDFKPFTAEFRDYDKLDDLIDGNDFDHFYHLAWQGTSSLGDGFNDYNTQIRNITAACDALTSIVRLGCKKCSFISSYQEADTIIHDDYNFNPVYYGITKRCANEMFKATAYKLGIPCVNLLFPNIYGVNDKPDVAIAFFIKCLIQNKELNLISGNYPDDWMPVNDLIDGIIAASKSSLEYGSYYVGHRVITTFKEKLVEMKRILNSTSELNWGKYPEKHYIDYSQLDLNALYLDTGWEAKTSFEESIIETAEWVKTI